MSTVRMCDFETTDGPCGTIFSEREANWSTGQMTVVGEDGEQTTVRADFCPDHTAQPGRKGRALPRFRAIPPALPANNVQVPDERDWSRGATTTDG